MDPAFEAATAAFESDQPTTERAAQLRRWDVDHVWHGFTQMAEYANAEPLVIDRAEGCWLIDVAGRRYLDGVASLWCNVHGHRRAEIDDAVRLQLDRVAHSTLLGISHEPAILLARRLVELAAPLACDGPPLTRVFYSDSGSTAVEVALKISFQYWRQRRPERGGPRPEKTRFMALSQAYHGDTVGSVSVGGMELFHEVFQPLLFPTWRAPEPFLYRYPQGTTAEQCRDDCLARMERILAEHHQEIAAVVLEPLVQGAAGMIVAPEGYLRGVRDLTRRYDVLLIADEVAVGIGRTGTMFACEQEHVVPDLLCLAKGLTGGYLPLAATLANEEIFAAFAGTQAELRTFFHGHTYGGNPLGAAAALATLEIFEREATLVGIQPRIEQLGGWMRRFAALPHVGDARQRGMMAGVELARDRDAKQPYDWSEQVGARVCWRARDRGVLIRPLGNVIVLMPPLAISKVELDLLGETVEQAIREVTDAAEIAS
jgi:adenosylmethionine-8-amino-7-oxononanoate aminotransferase